MNTTEPPLQADTQLPAGRPPETPPSPKPSPADGELSVSIPLNALASDESYVLFDEHGRVLCAEQKGSWGWAYLGDFDTYNSDVLHIAASPSGPGSPPALNVSAKDQSWSLYANGPIGGDPWLFASGQRWPGYPRLTLSPIAGGGTSHQFTLEIEIDGERKALKAGSNTWDWLYVANPGKEPTRFTLHRYHVSGNGLFDLINATWPSLPAGALFEVDAAYQAISSHHARQIWQDSGLGRCRWRSESFDCDDFAFVYKGQASLDAYHNNATHPYAVGWIAGLSGTDAHAVNLFLDLDGHLKILEPQTGEITLAQDWSYAPYQVMV
ncbi:lectin MOA-related protein [Pseudomonas entomophila]|uniref:lectin MOA-related protein n=1 Tax=Pseudomonas entomophila TaxID=312306 RepID=UPI001F00F212|nr:lectin MOA-related protein [Pseudomonas entomophila]MCG8293852.1 lectin MOA-related protein [Pseudomonas entomophila]